MWLHTSHAVVSHRVVAHKIDQSCRVRVRRWRASSSVPGDWVRDSGKRCPRVDRCEDLVDIAAEQKPRRFERASSKLTSGVKACKIARNSHCAYSCVEFLCTVRPHRTGQCAIFQHKSSTGSRLLPDRSGWLPQRANLAIPTPLSVTRPEFKRHQVREHMLLSHQRAILPLLATASNTLQAILRAHCNMSPAENVFLKQPTLEQQFEPNLRRGPVAQRFHCMPLRIY